VQPAFAVIFLFVGFLGLFVRQKTAANRIPALVVQEAYLAFLAAGARFLPIDDGDKLTVLVALIAIGLAVSSLRRTSLGRKDQ
jgi:hypothetical protein